ncbi:EAL domain-containing protein [Bacillus dakarensis]|uniref:EAL domain-containing protein n=1 Tax=Robertmurraya dakarensis TaxID=1926278 RepID=UPI000981DDEF|nr:EAL domain-containing protein [Bacillus dakarensis]
MLLIHWLNSFRRWGKIALPLKLIRYYPPQFILRDPISRGVKRSFKRGFEVAAIVFNIANLTEIGNQLDERNYKLFIKSFKNHVRQVIKNEVSSDEVLVLHDYHSDGVTLFLRVDHDWSSVSEIDVTMNTILENIEKSLKQDFSYIEINFQCGYMFVEKKHNTLKDAIYKAHQQAQAMAEKREQSKFNEMHYMISKIVSQKGIRILAQPIIDVQSKEIRAWEMLTRGPKDTFYESPLQLFSIARQTGMLYDLELVVLEKALEQVHSTGCRQDIFINFTPVSLGNHNIIKDVKRIMAKYKSIPPSQITLEITERDSIDEIEHLLHNVRTLRNYGFRLAVDDTGAGYASFNTISSVMPDIIKIDRSVIQDIDKNAVKESMLKGLLLVAKETGSLVVAEGIENAEEASVLSRNRVDLAQGYFFARPNSLQKGLKPS